MLPLLLSDDAAQDTFEYVLAIGVVVVAIAAGVFAMDDLVASIMGAACTSVDTAKQAVNCLNY